MKDGLQKCISIMDDAIANVMSDLQFRRDEMADSLRVFKDNAGKCSAKGIDVIQRDISDVQHVVAKVRQDEVLLSNLQRIRAKMLSAEWE